VLAGEINSHLAQIHVFTGCRRTPWQPVAVSQSITPFRWHCCRRRLNSGNNVSFGGIANGGSPSVRRVWTVEQPAFPGALPSLVIMMSGTLFAGVQSSGSRAWRDLTCIWRSHRIRSTARGLLNSWGAARKPRDQSTLLRYARRHERVAVNTVLGERSTFCALTALRYSCDDAARRKPAAVAASWLRRTLCCAHGRSTHLPASCCCVSRTTDAHACAIVLLEPGAPCTSTSATDGPASPVANSPAKGQQLVWYVAGGADASAVSPAW
jgi:hypothetical protein